MRHRPGNKLRAAERAAGLVSLAASLVVLLAIAMPALTRGPATLTVGRLRLQRCADEPGWWCGSLARALDPRRPSGARIAVAFRWLPAPGRAPALVALDGGPGSPSTKSADTYTDLFGPLMRRHGLLLVDPRGTAGSALINCPALQRYAAHTDDQSYVARVGACARSIDARYAGRVSAGTHPANLFGSAYAGDDIAAVVQALGLGRVDLYGVSYGTFLAQSIMARHSRLLRAVALDSAFPVRGLTPWYASSGAAARSALDAVCSRDASCRAAMSRRSGGPVRRLALLLRRLRGGPPLTVAVETRPGRLVRRTIDVRTLVDLVQDAGGDAIIDRELDAAVRAALGGDALPLARLAAGSGVSNHGAVAAEDDSNGLYFAVACTDYPQLFPMDATSAERRARLRDQIAGAASSTAFAPFTVREWLSMSAYSEPYAACLDWPYSPGIAPPVAAHAAPLPASVPVLRLGGDLDSITPVRDVYGLAPRLGRRSRVVVLRNTVHATTEGDDALLAGSACGQRLVLRFFADPDRLDRLDARCAGRVPAVHTTGAFPRRLADARPATVVAGTDPGLAVRRAVTVGAAAVADAATRLIAHDRRRGTGLRGGTFTAVGDDLERLSLREVRFVTDATVSGRATYRRSDGAVRADVLVRRRGARPVRVRVSWLQSRPEAHAGARGACLVLPAS